MADLLKDKQFKDESSVKESWYQRTAINIAVITGLAFGISKMKGPFAKLVGNVQTQHANFLAQKEEDKMKRADYIIKGDDLDLESVIKSRTIDPFDPTLPVNKQQLMTEPSLVSRIVDLESALLKAENKSVEGDTSWNHLGNSADEFWKNRSDIYAQLRHEVLMDFLSKESVLNGGPNYSYDQIRHSLKDTKQLGQIFEYYLENSPEFARMYRRSLDKMANNFRLSSRSFPLNALKDRNVFTTFLYNNKFDSTMFAEAEIYAARLNDVPTRVRKVYGGVVPDRQGQTSFDLLDEFHTNKLDESNRWISASHKFKQTGEELFDQIGKFDYTGHFKRIASILDKAQGDPTSPIENASLKLEFRGDSAYAVMGLQVKGKKGSYQLAIPISRDGKLPGSSRSATPRLDSFFAKGNEFGLDMNKSIWINKSQDILRKVSERLDSAFLNRLADDPHGAMKSLHNMVMDEEMTLPLLTGETRDIFKMLSVRHPELTSLVKSSPGENTAMKSYLRDAVESANNVRRMVDAKKKGKRVVGIGFDLETIGFGNMGPSAQVRDPHTQIHTAAISEFVMGETGLVASNSEEMVSTHVIDYMNKNNGWVDSKQGNITWLRKLFEMPTAEESEVRKAFQNYLERRSKGGPRYNSNDEYLRAVAKKILAKIEAAADSDTEVFLVTKNGTMFDLQFLYKYAPMEYESIMKKARHIDTHSIAYWRKHSTYGEESLRLKSLVSKMLGEYGEDVTIDIERVGGLERFKGALENLKRKGNTVLDFSKEFNERAKEIFSGKAHLSPEADNIGNFAMLSKYIADVKGNASHFSVAHLSKLGRLAAMADRPLNLQEDQELFNMLGGGTTQYGFVKSAAGVTSNMLAKNILSMMDLSMMLSHPDVPGNKQWDQLFRGPMNIRESSKYRQMMERGEASGQDRQFMFDNPYMTKYAKLAEDVTKIRAHDRTNQFAKTVTARTFASFNMFQGREGMANMSRSFASKLSFSRLQTIPLNDTTFDSMPEIAEDLRRYRRRVEEAARILADRRGPGSVPSSRDYAVAGRYVSRDPKMQLRIHSSHSLAQGDFGVKTTSAEMGGKIIGVEVEENVFDPRATPLIKARVEFMATGDQLRNVTMRGFAAKSSLTISDANTYGHDTHIHADFIDKGYSGSAKQVYMATAIDNLRRKTMDKGPDGRRAEEQLKKLAIKLNATWTGTQMLTNPHAPSTMKFKHAKNAAEQEAMRRYMGAVDIDFKDIMNLIAESGQSWKNEDELAKGYYQFYAGNVGKSVDINKKGHQIMSQILAKQFDKWSEEFDKQAKAGEEGLAYFNQEDLYKIKRDVREFWEMTLLPTVGKAKLLQFLNPEGKISENPNYHNHTMGMSIVDVNSFSDINEGKAIRDGTFKLRPAHKKIIDSAGNTVTSGLRKYIETNQRVRWHGEYNKAQKKLQQLRNEFFAKAMSKTELSLEDINDLLDRTSTVALGEEPMRQLSEMDEESLRTKLKQMTTFNNATEEEIDSKINSIVSEIKSKKVKVSLADNMRWMSMSEIQKWTKMAGKYAAYDMKDAAARGLDPTQAGGVFRVSTGIKEGLKIDFNDVMRDSNIKNKITQTDVTGMMGFFKDIQAKSGPKGIVKEIIDKIDEKSGKRTQQVVLNQIILPAMDAPKLTANIVTNSLGLATDHTQLSKEILSHMRKLDEGSLNDKGQEAERSIIAKKYVDLIINGFNIHHQGVFGGAGVYELPGLRGSARGAEAIVTQAYNIKQAGIKNALKGYKGNIELAGNIIDKILTADKSTVFVARSVLEQMPTRLDDGTTIRYARLLDKMVANKTLTGDQAEDFLSGKQNVYGYHGREPSEMNARDAIVDVKLQSIPDELLDHVGADRNAFFSLHLMEIQKLDFDADQDVIGLRNFDTIEQLKQYATEHKANLQEIVKRSDVMSIEKKRKAPIGFSAGGSAAFASFDDNGVLQIEERKLDSMSSDEIINFKDSLGKIGKQIMMNQPEVMTMGYIKRSTDMVAYNALMKNQIGVATNLIGTYSFRLQEAGILKNPRLANDLIGNLSFGLPHLNQKLMEMGKHGSEQAVAGFTAAIDALRNPTKRTKAGEDYIRNIFTDSFKKAAEAKGEKLYQGLEPGEYADRMLKHMFNVPEALNVSTGGDPYHKFVLRAMEAENLGKSRGLTEEFVSDEGLRSSINRTVYSNMMDMGIVQSNSIIPERSIVDDLNDTFKRKFNISDNFSTGFKHGGKFAAIGAAAFLALNFFRPNQLSSSTNPLDMFVDLGTSIDGNHNRIDSSVQLDRRLPLDMIGASFSKQAFIRTSSADYNNDNSRKRAEVIKEMVKSQFSNSPSYKNFESKGNTTYTNYTSQISYFGSSNLERKFG